MKDMILKNSTNAIVLALVALGAMFIKGNCLWMLDEPNLPQELR